MLHSSTEYHSIDGSETARSELEEICEVVMESKYEIFKEQQEKGKREGKVTPSTIQRFRDSDLQVLALQLGLSLPVSSPLCL